MIISLKFVWNYFIQFYCDFSEEMFKYVFWPAPISWQEMLYEVPEQMGYRPRTIFLYTYMKYSVTNSVLCAYINYNVWKIAIVDIRNVESL